MLDWLKWRVRTRQRDWVKQRGSAPPGQADPETEAPKRPSTAMAGKYLSLYTYLENRYANYVVLTFGQIEDLLGFRLPDTAHRQQEWWTDVTPAAGPNHSQAWTLASRTAKPNLSAHTVVFERIP